MTTDIITEIAQYSSYRTIVELSRLSKNIYNHFFNIGILHDIGYRYIRYEKEKLGLCTGGYSEEKEITIRYGLRGDVLFTGVPSLIIIRLIMSFELKFVNRLGLSYLLPRYKNRYFTKIGVRNN